MSDSRYVNDPPVGQTACRPTHETLGMTHHQAIGAVLRTRNNAADRQMRGLVQWGFQVMSFKYN